jgi:hypothetical protein
MASLLIMAVVSREALRKRKLSSAAVIHITIILYLFIPSKGLHKLLRSIVIRPNYLFDNPKDIML